MNTISATNSKLSLQDISHDLTPAEMNRIAGGVSYCHNVNRRRGEEVRLNLTSRSWSDSETSNGLAVHKIKIKENVGSVECGI